MEEAAINQHTNAAVIEEVFRARHGAGSAEKRQLGHAKILVEQPIRRRRPLFQVPAAVDTNRFAGNEVAVDERQHRLRDLGLAAPASERRRTLDACKLFV